MYAEPKTLYGFQATAVRLKDWWEAANKKTGDTED